MRRWLIGIFAGCALAGAFAAYGVSSGGFPSRPFLQALGVGEPAPATAGQISASGNISSGGQISATGNISGAQVSASGAVLVGNHITFDENTASDGYVSAANASGAYRGIALESNSSTSATQQDATAPSWVIDLGGRAADNSTWSSNDADAFTIFRVPPGGSYLTASGAAAFRITSSGTVEAGGIPLQLAAIVTTSSSACSFTTNVGFSSCARNFAGSYTLTFSGTYSRDPVCVAGAYGSNLSAQAGSETTSTNTVYVYNGTTLTDGYTFRIVCE